MKKLMLCIKCGNFVRNFYCGEVISIPKFTSGIKSASTGFFPEGLLGTATASNQTEEEGITAINAMGSSDDPVVLIFAASIRQCL